MKGIVVFEEGGVARASVGLEDVRVHPSIFSSFMTAIQSYASRFTGSRMREVRYSNIRMIIGHVGENHVVTLHSVDDPDAEWNHGATMRVIESEEDFLLDDQFLGVLRELLTDERVSVDDVRPPT
ncbi:hypothetical protein EU546_05575 [Candidatus Thorarchaeota archaeon]|nr:MAG: hypothetical protein EU546_05575 [Candidatus Thorarchaeota archaeon]